MVGAIKWKKLKVLSIASIAKDFEVTEFKSDSLKLKIERKKRRDKKTRNFENKLLVI